MSADFHNKKLADFDKNHAKKFRKNKISRNTVFYVQICKRRCQWIIAYILIYQM